MSADAERLTAAHAAYKAAHGTPKAPAAYRELERVVDGLRARAADGARLAPSGDAAPGALEAAPACAAADGERIGTIASAHGGASEAGHAR